MATVVWTKQALNQRLLLYKNGVLEFGVSVAISTAERINSIAEKPGEENKNITTTK